MEKNLKGLVIGNLVELAKTVKEDFFNSTGVVPGGPYFIVASTSQDTVNLWIDGDEYDFCLSELKPIKLTQEIVIKLGGKPMGKRAYLSITQIKAELHFEFVGDEVVTSLKSDFSDLIMDSIEHIHTLQNFYYILSKGEELGIL
jgi:hypothetical protein